MAYIEREEDLLALPDFLSILEEKVRSLKASDLTPREKNLCAMMFVQSVDALQLVRNSRTLVAGWGSAREHPSTDKFKLSKNTGLLFAEAGYDAVYGDGPGFMQGFAEGILEGGADVYGYQILSKSVWEKEPMHCTTHRVEHHNMHTRNFAFLEVSAGFLAFDYGIGSLLEKSEFLTAVQMGLMVRKPFVCIGDEWPEWQQLLERMAKDGRINDEELELFCITSDPKKALDVMLKHAPPVKRQAIALTR